MGCTFVCAGLESRLLPRYDSAQCVRILRWHTSVLSQFGTRTAPLGIAIEHYCACSSRGLATYKVFGFKRLSRVPSLYIRRRVGRVAHSSRCTRARRCADSFVLSYISNTDYSCDSYFFSFIALWIFLALRKRSRVFLWRL